MTPAQIRETRDALGLTQRQLAAVMGLRGPATVAEWEKGKRNISPPAARLIRLYLALHDQAPHMLPVDWPKGDDR